MVLNSGEILLNLDKIDISRNQSSLLSTPIKPSSHNVVLIQQFNHLKSINQGAKHLPEV
jgi:hypothetical protein